MFGQKSRGVLGIGAAAALLTLGACAHKSQTPAAPAPSAQPAVVQATTAPGAAAATQPSEYAWKSLFDGKTLGNWAVIEYGSNGTPVVRDGALILPAGGPLTGVNWTGGDIPKMNYEIALEAQRMDGSDFFCALTVPVADSHVSLVLGGWGGSLCGISSIDGYDAANNETTKMINFQEKRWYRVRMRVLKDKLQVWLDDDQVVDVSTTDRRLGVRIEVEASKPLGISAFQTTGAVRDIRVRTLRPDEIEG